MTGIMELARERTKERYKEMEMNRIGLIMDSDTRHLIRAVAAEKALHAAWEALYAAEVVIAGGNQTVLERNEAWVHYRKSLEEAWKESGKAAKHLPYPDPETRRECSTFDDGNGVEFLHP